MFFRQLINGDLGCASYVLGDDGRAVVIDPGLAVDEVLAAAAAEGARIEAIAETHVHADHVSGRALLAARTGARVHVPAGAGVDAAAGTPLRPGDLIEVGAVRLEALATPGHRPEHLAFLVTDTARDAQPCLLLAGDSVLVGDLARPDLAVEPGEGARQLHGTIARLDALPDELELWPGHVGGSLCGGGRLSRRPSSTLGYERRVNALLAERDAGRFAARLVADLPVRPPTVEAVVRRNRSAAPVALLPAADAAPAALASLLAAGAVVADGRAAEAFDAAQVVGAVNLPLVRNGVGTRAGWLLDLGRPVLAAAGDTGGATELARRLAAVGLDVAAAAPFAIYEAAGCTVVQGVAIAAAELALGGAWTVVDVRDDDELRRLPLPGAVHLPLSRLRAEADGLPGGPLAVVCASGVRAASAASVLRALGHDARRVTGGAADVLAAVAMCEAA